MLSVGKRTTRCFLLQPQVRQTAEDKTQKEEVALRVTLVQEFADEDVWKKARKKPEQTIAGAILSPKLDGRSYGWTEQEYRK